MTLLQLIAIVSVICYYNDKPPPIVYTTYMSQHDGANIYNYSRHTSNIRFWVTHSHDQPIYMVGTEDLGATDNVDSVDVNKSTMQITQLNPFLLFVPCSLLAVFFSFLTLRVIDNGQINCNATYGEHGVSDSIGWEIMFWVYTWVQHGVVVCIMSSPADAIYITFESFVVCTLLGLFCCLNSNTSADHPSRRLESPVLILLCLCYILFISNSKTMISTHVTYLTWMIYLGMDALLIVGHTWDSVVLCETVVNCRWSYVIACGFVNVFLYAAYSPMSFTPVLSHDDVYHQP